MAEQVRRHEQSHGQGIVLWNSRHFTITYRVAHNILVMKRSAEPIEQIEDYREECSAIADVMRKNDKVRGIVIDMRDAAARRDRPYEEITRSLSATTFAIFPRVAMLFRSAAGALQMRRFTGPYASKLRSTTDEEEAISFASNYF